MSRRGTELNRHCHDVSVNIPLKIVETQGTYSLKLEDPMSLSIAIPFHSQIHSGPVSNFQTSFQKLKEALAASCEFTARAARTRLNLPLTTCNRLLSWAEKEGLLIRRHSGPATFYVFARSIAD